MIIKGSHILSSRCTNIKIYSAVYYYALTFEKQPSVSFLNVNARDSGIWIGQMWILYDVLLRVISECRSNHLFAERMGVCSNIKFLCIKMLIGIYSIDPKFVFLTISYGLGIDAGAAQPEILQWGKLLIWSILILSHWYHYNGWVKSGKSIQRARCLGCWCFCYVLSNCTVLLYMDI